MGGNLEVVLTPALLPFYDLKDKTVVMIDILRAGTSICVAMNTGVKRIIPVSSPEEAVTFKDFGFICAAERNALKVDGFDLGNSPFEFQNPLLRDQSIAFTTTNGTKAIQLAKKMGAKEMIIGSFLNISAVCEYLKLNAAAVILLCAGWKDKFNLEDTLFAGAVVHRIRDSFITESDSALAAESLYLSAINDLEAYVRKSSHANRFKLMHTDHDDVHFCMQTDTMRIVPRMQGEYIMSNEQALAT